MHDQVVQTGQTQMSVRFQDNKQREAKLASVCSQKDNALMGTNEKLWKEKKELLHKEAEEMGSKGIMTTSIAQHRVELLEAHNRQLPSSSPV